MLNRVSGIAIATTLSCTFLLTSPANAQSGRGASKHLRYFTTGMGTMDMWDVVSFFSKSPVKGTHQYHHEYDGSLWFFSSKANRDKFKASPRSYVPQFGGYCAYSMARGLFQPPDVANAWSIHRGKLYFQSASKTATLWKANMGDFIRRGEAQWRKLKPVRQYYTPTKSKKKRRKK